jgi:hypothetical protein
MPKFVRADFLPMKGELWIFNCPGCECDHWVRSEGPKPRWTIEGIDNNKPTVRPSLIVRGQYRCHSFIDNGMIRFLGDCDHKLKGQTVEIPEYMEW